MCSCLHYVPFCWAYVTSLIRNLERLQGEEPQRSRLSCRWKAPRSTIHQIINRLGIDNLVGQIARLREDDRFKAVGPDNVVLVSPFTTKSGPTVPNQTPHEEAEMWFDWAFIDFWKSNYCENASYLHLTFWLISNRARCCTTRTYHRSWSSVCICWWASFMHYSPRICHSSMMDDFQGQNPETVMLVSSLREVIRRQAEEIESLQKQLKEQPVQTNEVSDHLRRSFDHVS